MRWKITLPLDARELSLSERLVKLAVYTLRRDADDHIKDEDPD